MQGMFLLILGFIWYELVGIFKMVLGVRNPITSKISLATSTSARKYLF